MVFVEQLILILCLLIQSGSVPSFSDDIFSPKEKTKLEKASSVKGRIKIYRTASIRIQKSIHEAVKDETFGTIPDNLKLWTSLLSQSLIDIETNLQSKKKPRELIQYEIQVRKAIAALQDDQIKAPLNQHDQFESCIAQAEEIRKRFVEILFRY